MGLGALDGPEIKRVWVLPVAQGCGVGAALVRAQEAEAAARGRASVTVEASRSSVEFYRARGYEAVEERRLEVGAASFGFTTRQRRPG